MTRKRHTEEQIIAILKKHEAGMKTADLLPWNWKRERQQKAAA